MLAKAGYDPDDLVGYFKDLAVLATRLGIVAVGINKSTAEFVNLDAMSALSLTPDGQQFLRRIHVRLYSRSDYVDRWSAMFASPTVAVAATAVAGKKSIAAVAALAAEMKRKKLTRRKLAHSLGADPSFVSKLFRGKKSWPAGLFDRSLAWVANQPQLSAPTLMIACSQNEQFEMLDVALDYLQRGWAVVPQLAGSKNPCVRWKPFQSRLPEEQELRRWFSKWPSAGLAVVLGPVSNLFVVDVDGDEANAALFARLSIEPQTPKALSGSGKSNRYHLFFRHPDIPTKAKFTPWCETLEFRGNRGIVIIPPSVHKSGNRYAWAPGRSLNDMPLSAVPEAILEALRDSAHRPTIRPSRQTEAAPTIVVPRIDACPATRRISYRHTRTDRGGTNGYSTQPVT